MSAKVTRLNFVRTGATMFAPFYITELREQDVTVYDPTRFVTQVFIGHAIYERSHERPYAGDRKVCEFPDDVLFEEVRRIANLLNKQHRIEMMLPVNNEE